MENLVLALAAAFLFSRAEEVPQRFAVSSCGRTVRLPRMPITRQLADDAGNPVYVGQAAEKGVTFGFATVELNRPFTDRALAEQALFLFMEDMHPSFHIEYTTGLSHGFSHPHSADVWGMTEYWQDAEGMDWKVQGWTDGRVMTALYVKNIGSASQEEQERFLNSFAFNPGQKLVQ